MQPDAAALRYVPGLEHGAAPLAVERLAGGSVNEVFRVDTAAGQFVLRLDGPHWRRPGVDRARELALHARAAAAGLAPSLVHAPAGTGLLVMEYVPGRPWSERDFESPPALERLGRRLAQLHELVPPRQVAVFDPLQVARGYAARIEAREGRARAGDVEPVLARLLAVGAQLSRITRPPAIVHGDLVHSNLIEGARLWLVDWEYAQVSDPLMDVACLLAYYPGARAHAPVVLATAGLAADAEELRLRIYIYEALSWLWYRARGEAAAAPGGTGVLAGAPAN
jgi:thiamine kinase-like enzyme